MAEGIKSNVRAQKDTLYLTLVDHGISINDDGTIDLNITYRGRLEALMKSRKMNILLPAGGQLANEIKFKVDGEGSNEYTFEGAEQEVKKINKPGKKLTTKDEERVKNFEKALADTNVKYKQIIHAYLLDRMFSEGLLYEYTVSESDLNQFLKFQAEVEGASILPNPVSYNALDRGIKTADSAYESGQDIVLSAVDVDEVAGEIEDQQSSLTQANLDSPRKLRFFYFGDLLGIVLDHVTGQNTGKGKLTRKFFGGTELSLEKIKGPSRIVKEIEESLKTFRLVLGNMDVDSGRSKASQGRSKVNIAHIPISFDAFNTFFINSVLAKERTTYPFFDFVDDVLNELIMDPASSSCFGGLFNLDFKPKVQSYSVPNPIPDSYFKESVSGYEVVDLKDTSPDKPVFQYETDTSSIVDLYEYVVIGAEATNYDFLTGNEEDDYNRNIIHLHFGNAIGLVKNISFNKTDQEFLPEARYAEEGNFLFNQLANVYDVTVEMIGNNLFKPGQHIYINTDIIGAGSSYELVQNDTTGEITHRSWANLMGLGGYHLVTEVAQHISRNGYNTSIKARWVSSGKSDVAPERTTPADTAG